MAINFLTDYPKTLTNKAWQKEKSVADKLKSKTKTGLGEDLEAAEKAWNSINFECMIADNAMFAVDKGGKYRGEEEFDFAKGVATAELKNSVAVARKVLMRASGTARDTSMNKDLSKDAIKKAQEISKGLLDLEAKLRDITLDDFDEKKQRFTQLKAMQLKALAKDIVNLEKALIAVAKTPTLEFWNDNVKQKFRSVGNTLGNFNEFKEEWKTWQPWDGFQAERHPLVKASKKKDPAVEEKAIKLILKETIPELAKLKKKVANG
ncbi:MAG: hypothetical protein JNK76_18405 [Planctomycetales bacterium]|nr:hypothetical protein [Planctomycetales bacterium]MBN8625492.1 hypothetical protein [Planctomycetota bacterium]